LARIKMTIEYDGSRYHGFQIQNNANTIQAELEKAIKSITGESTSILCAGRTDAGVHALGQVIAFDTNATIPGDKWQFALNSFLPPDIKVINSSLCQPDFHPRFDAVSKVYHYLIYRQREGYVFNRNYAYCDSEYLDIEAMQQACSLFLGKHNFRSFCASGSSVKTFERCIMECQLKQEGPYLRFIVEANGFLYNMVRIIVGTLLQIGREVYPPAKIKEIIKAQDRKQAGPTAPPQGLYLAEVKY